MVTEERAGSKNDLLYGVDDKLSIISTILFGMQQVMVGICSTLIAPILVSGAICATQLDQDGLVYLIGTTLITVGFSTVLQTAIGIRLPLLQGPSFSFLPPIFVLMASPALKCPDISTFNMTSNATNSPLTDYGTWQSRMTLIQGGLITASLVQMLIGATGLLGVITRHIGPLTIAPLMVLLELSVVPVTANYLTQHWISVVLIALLILFAFYLSEVPVPLPVIDFGSRNCSLKRMRLFSMFPASEQLILAYTTFQRTQPTAYLAIWYLMAIGITWLLAYVLTVTCVFNKTTDWHGRTDINADRIANAAWIRFPYPGQWGMPRVNLAAFIGMVAGTICSIVESVGDYAACARIVGHPRLPAHAVNRGIFIEGFCCFVGGWLGGSVSVTTYSENVGVIGITRVASRVMMICAGVILIILGLFTKFGAIMSTIPTPLVGGILLISLSVVGGVGLSSTQLLDMTITRNLAILGLAIMSGVMIPLIYEANPIVTGVSEIDQALEVLLKTNMIVGGFIGFFLDNTVPGATPKQRGLHRKSNEISDEPDERSDFKTTDSIYALPWFIQQHLNNWSWTKYIPILPNFSRRKIQPMDSTTGAIKTSGQFAMGNANGNTTPTANSSAPEITVIELT